MVENLKRMVDRATAREMGTSRRANGHNGDHAPAGLFSWYRAQPTQPGATYALTITGYVILTHKN